MITDEDDYELPANYLDHLVLPPRSELWAAVQEAHDYLHEWVHNPSSRLHPTYGKVVFEAGTWGRSIFSDICWVCLAGLRYLRKEDSLLGLDVEQNGEDISATDYFLDALRNPWINGEYIQQWLGITMPVDMSEYEGIWDSEGPEGILTFLGWLLDAGKEQGVYEPTTT